MNMQVQALTTTGHFVFLMFDCLLIGGLITSAVILPWSEVGTAIIQITGRLSALHA